VCVCVSACQEQETGCRTPALHHKFHLWGRSFMGRVGTLIKGAPGGVRPAHQRALLVASHVMGFWLQLLGAAWLSGTCSQWGRHEWEWRAKHLGKTSEMHERVAVRTAHSIPCAYAAGAASMHPR